MNLLHLSAAEIFLNGFDSDFFGFLSAFGLTALRECVTTFGGTVLLVPFILKGATEFAVTGGGVVPGSVTLPVRDRGRWSEGRFGCGS